MSEESSPIDGEEIKPDLIPHHQRQAAKQEGGFLNTLLTGGVVVGAIVGLYLLWKHLLGRKEDRKTSGAKEGGQTGSQGNRRLTKRAITYPEADKLRAVYAEALANEKFLEFLETFVRSEDFDTALFAVARGE